MSVFRCSVLCQTLLSKFVVLFCLAVPVLFFVCVCVCVCGMAGEGGSGGKVGRAEDNTVRVDRHFNFAKTATLAV